MRTFVSTLHLGNALAALVLLALGVAPVAALPPIPAGEFHIYTNASQTQTGLIGSYVNQALGSHQEQVDWRTTFPIARARRDEVIDFSTNQWGDRNSMYITGGPGDDWDNFSVQWDGYIQIVTPGMRLATISDDGSRMWLDLNHDDAFSATTEFFNNNWGVGQGATLGAETPPLDAGVYRIRIQYEDIYWGDRMTLVSVPECTVRVVYVVPSNRTPQPWAVENLRSVVLLDWHWMADQMDRLGFGRRTFRYETEADGITPKINVVYSSLTDDYIWGDMWGRSLEAAGMRWDPGEIWLIYPETHLQHPDSSITGGTALGGGSGDGPGPGAAVVGAAWLLWGNEAGLADDTAYAGKIVPHIGPYPLVQDVSFVWFEGPTYSSIASSYVGATMHEVGHAFGLPHDGRNDSNFHGNVMYNGLRGPRGNAYPMWYSADDMHLSYAAGLALSVNRYFYNLPTTRERDAAFAAYVDLGPGGESEADWEGPRWRENQPVASDDQMPLPFAGTREGDNTDPIVTITTTGSVTPVNGHVLIHFTASDDSGLKAAFLRRGGDWIGEMDLTGQTSVELDFATPFYTPGEDNEFGIMVCDTSSNRYDVATHVTPASGVNRGPQAHFKMTPSQARVGQVIHLDAGWSSDPDNSAGGMRYEWDLDGDGTFDTTPSTTKTRDVSYATACTPRIRVRVRDGAGAISIAGPIAARVVDEPADRNCDSFVNFVDRYVVLRSLLGPNLSSVNGDVDGDGDTDLDDYARLMIAAQ